AYEDAIATDPRCRPPRDRLERILHQLGDLAGLRRHYADELKVATSPARKMFLLSVLAQLHAADSGSDAAIGYLTALLKQKNDHLSSIQLLARLLSKSSREKDLLKVTLQEVKLTASAPRRAKLLHRAGELALQTEDRALARKSFEQALESVDDHLPSLEGLSRLLREEGDDEALVAVLRKELLYATDRARQVTLQLEIARLYAAKLGQPQLALAELRSLLQRWPRHLPALHAAEGLAASIGDTRAQLEFLEQHIAAISGPRTRALLLHRAARLHDRLEDDEGAIRALVRALELWPELGVARTMLLALYERLGRSKELQSFAEAALRQDRGADERRAMALQLAELSPQPEVALEYLEAVAQARPEDFVTQLRLARAAREASQWNAEASAMTQVVEQFRHHGDPSDPSVLALAFLGARASEAAGDLDTADERYAAVLAQDPGHVLARRGRARIARLREQPDASRTVERFESATRDVDSGPTKAALFTRAAEIHERR